MKSFAYWLAENADVIFLDSDDFNNDNSKYMDQGWDMARTSPINILRNKDLKAVAVNNDEVVGALYDSWTNEEYSFDVIVSPKFQQQGIGKKLIDAAMSSFRWDSEGRGENAHIKLEVVNKNLIPILTRIGFKTEKVIGTVTIMTYGG